MIYLSTVFFFHLFLLFPSPFFLYLKMFSLVLLHICCVSSAYLSITPDPDFLQSFRSLRIFPPFSFSFSPQITHFPLTFYFPSTQSILFSFFICLFCYFPYSYHLPSLFFLHLSFLMYLLHHVCFSAVTLSSPTLSLFYLVTTSIISSSHLAFLASKTEFLEHILHNIANEHHQCRSRRRITRYCSAAVSCEEAWVGSQCSTAVSCEQSSPRFAGES